MNLVLHARNDDLIQFVKEYRRINPKLSIQEAKNDFQEFRNILENGHQRNKREFSYK